MGCAKTPRPGMRAPEFSEGAGWAKATVATMSGRDSFDMVFQNILPRISVLGSWPATIIHPTASVGALFFHCFIPTTFVRSRIEPMKKIARTLRRHREL